MVWAVATTDRRFGAEVKAQSRLLELGVESYVPRFQDRYKRIFVLFAGYVFVNLVKEFNWFSLFRTRGVKRLLLMNGKPSPVPDLFVDELKAYYGPQGFRPWADMRTTFLVGQPVRITHGHFKDRVGTYQGMSRLERERVLLELLGRKVTVELDEDYLAPAA